MSSLNMTLKASANGSFTKTRANGIVLSYAPGLSFIQAFTPGTASDQCDILFDTSSTLALSTAETWDLSGSLTDAFGDPAIFAKVKVLFIKAAEGNTNDLVVGNATAPWIGPFGSGTHTVAVRPGGCILFMAPNAGWTVTATTADGLKVLNGGAGTPVSYDMTILGTSV